MQHWKKSPVRTFLRKPKSRLTIGDFRAFVRRRRGPKGVVQTTKNRELLLILLGVQRIWDALTLEELRQFVTPLELIRFDEWDRPHDLYRLATLANIIGHGIVERAGQKTEEGRRAIAIKNRAIAHLIERFGDDIEIITERGVKIDALFLVVRLRSPYTRGLHARKTSVDRYRTATA